MNVLKSERAIRWWIDCIATGEGNLLVAASQVSFNLFQAWDVNIYNTFNLASVSLRAVS